ncbi:MAG: CoB--CoM heterodisulfide reductase iron-sulfur subunit A family protein [Candidatus Bathyarchaeia archaeon]
MDVWRVTDYAKTLPDVAVARHYTYTCSDPGQRMIIEDIKNYGIDRVVVAACSPRMHEETFRETVARAGLNPYLLEIVNLREHVSWVHSEEPENATAKAMDLVRIGVAKARLLEPLQKKKVSVEKSVLVIGGGIAGIQAALDIADAGLDVVLVEKSPTIGGKMALLDKTFPTLDCSACILTPKMTEVARHPRIRLLTYAEVESVSGYVGNYEVTILKKARYVDENKCRGCGVCATKCPVKVPDEFNMGLGSRKAIFIPFPQAVPLVYTIDKEHCLYFTKGVCKVCEKFCEAKAINFEQTPQRIKIKVGGIVIAVGAELFDAAQADEFAFGKSKNIITNLQFERLTNASGPTRGEILCPETDEKPRSIVFVQCIGSRDRRFNEYCCRIGCMVTLKQAILAREKLGKDVDIYVCHIDIRSFGKGYEEFYRKARDMDIKFIAGIPSEIHVEVDGTIRLEVFDKLTSKLLEIRSDLIVLACGLTPDRDLKKISELLHISRGSDGFLLEAHPKLRPLESAVPGIFLAGTCQGPKDIPDTVAQASGAAAKAVNLLASGELELEPLKGVVNEELCSGCRICELICPFSAIKMKSENLGEAEKLKAEIIEAVCQGCGLCEAACPVKAIKIHLYTDEQIIAQVRAAYLGESQTTGGIK